MIAAVDLSPTAAARLAAALNAERRRVLQMGGGWPVELDQLAAIAVRPVRSGQLPVTSGQSSPRSCDCAEDDLVSLRGTAQLLGVSERTLRRLRADGSIPTVEVAGRRGTRRSAISAYIKENER